MRGSICNRDINLEPRRRERQDGWRIPVKICKAKVSQMKKNYWELCWNVSEINVRPVTVLVRTAFVLWTCSKAYALSGLDKFSNISCKFLSTRVSSGQLGIDNTVVSVFWVYKRLLLLVLDVSAHGHPEGAYGRVKVCLLE